MDFLGHSGNLVLNSSNLSGVLVCVDGWGMIDRHTQRHDRQMIGVATRQGGSRCSTSSAV